MPRARHQVRRPHSLGAVLAPGVVGHELAIPEIIARRETKYQENFKTRNPLGFDADPIKG